MRINGGGEGGDQAGPGQKIGDRGSPLLIGVDSSLGGAAIARRNVWVSEVERNKPDCGDSHRVVLNSVVSRVS